MTADVRPFCWQVVTPAGMEPDDRDWRAKQPAAAAAPAEASAAAPAAAAAGGGGEGRWLQETGGQAGSKAREPPRMAPPANAAAPSADGQQASSGAAPTQQPQAPQVCMRHALTSMNCWPLTWHPSVQPGPAEECCQQQLASPGPWKIGVCGAKSATLICKSVMMNVGEWASAVHITCCCASPNKDRLISACESAPQMPYGGESSLMCTSEPYRPVREWQCVICV